jgi:hypothetical protein
MSSSKKILVKALAAGVYLSEAQSPIPSPTKRLYTTIYLFTQEVGGRVEPERRLERQQFTKLGRKYQHD